VTIVIDHDLRLLLGAVRDQGPRTTCLANATTTAHERSRGAPDPLSPQYLHYFATGGAARVGCGFPAMQSALRSHGQPSESDCPHTITEPDNQWQPPDGLRVFRRATAHEVDHALIRQSVQQNQVVVLGIELTTGFHRPADPWIISPSRKTGTLHAVAAVGCGRTEGKALVLIRNSWGTTWADGGHAWLDEKFVQQHVRELLIMREEIN
jgi:Papain family cysteine protease